MRLSSKIYLALALAAFALSLAQAQDANPIPRSTTIGSGQNPTSNAGNAADIIRVLSTANTIGNNTANYPNPNTHPTRSTTTRATTNAANINPSDWLNHSDKRMETQQTSATPPISGVDVPFQTFQFDAAQGGTFQSPSGSSISIPQNAFVNAQGQPITGKVEVQYREFHDATDIIASGIPMHDANTGLMMETAGMFQLQANQNGNEVSIQNGQNITIRLASYNEGNDFDYWRLDPTTGQWIEIDGAGQPAATPYTSTSSLDSLDLSDSTRIANNEGKIAEDIQRPVVIRTVMIQEPGTCNTDRLRKVTMPVPLTRNATIQFDKNAGLGTEFNGVYKIKFFWVMNNGRSVVRLNYNQVKDLAFANNKDLVVAVFPNNKIATFRGTEWEKIIKENALNTNPIYSFTTANTTIKTLKDLKKAIGSFL